MKWHSGPIGDLTMIVIVVVIVVGAAIVCGLAGPM